MCRKRNEPKIYKHEVLVKDLNELIIRVKTHLYGLGDAEFREMHPAPHIEELDLVVTRVINALLAENSPAVKY